MPYMDPMGIYIYFYRIFIHVDGDILFGFLGGGSTRLLNPADLTCELSMRTEDGLPGRIRG